MIIKLVKRFEINNKFNEIKKHFKTAKKHKSSEELEKVKHELLNFQDNLIKNNDITEKISYTIYNLLCEIDYARINPNLIDRRSFWGYGDWSNRKLIKVKQKA